MNGNLLFVTGCYPKEHEAFFTDNSKVMPQIAANVLSWRIIEGLEENIPGRFKVLTCPFIGYYPKQFTKLWIPDMKWSHNGHDEDDLYGFINIKGIETLQKSERIYKYVLNWYIKDKENRTVLFYSHYAGFLRALGMIRKKMPDMQLVCLVTDMNELDERKDLQGIIGKIKGIPRQLMIHTTYKNLQYVTSFVVLAREMTNYLNVGKRNYVVVEGIAKNDSMKKEISSKYQKTKSEFRVVYTGTLHERYGVLELSKAINCIKKQNIHLYLCGSGDGIEKLLEIIKQTNRIHYLGALPHQDAIELQSTADLLVNSMPEFGIHTSLSFPSKTMEYMLCGKPVLCFKVKGIPEEYDNYLLYFDSFDYHSMADKIVEISEYDRNTLQEIGRKNRQFVLDNKTPAKMVKRILDMLK